MHGEQQPAENDAAAMESAPRYFNGAVVTAVACGAYHTVCIANGGLYAAGNNSRGQLALGDTNNRYNLTYVPNSGNNMAVACGAYHTVCLANGQLRAAGYNSNGQLGVGDNLNRYYLTFCP